MRYKLDEYVLYLYPEGNEEKADLINSEKQIAKVISEKDPDTNKIKLDLLLRGDVQIETNEDNIIKLSLNSVNHKTNKKWGELFLEKLQFSKLTTNINGAKTYLRENVLIIDFSNIDFPNSNSIISGFRLAKDYRTNDNASIEEFIDKNFNTESYNDNFRVIVTFNDLINLLDEEKLLPSPKDDIWRSIAYISLIEPATEKVAQINL